MDFIEYFGMVNSHMFCIEVIKNHVFEFVPPNQLDWTYKVAKIGNNVWNVEGKKNDVYAIDEPQYLNCDYWDLGDGWTVKDDHVDSPATP
jgi:hypothetical protein